MTEAAPRRRWLRYSLRMFLVLIAMLAVGLGLFVRYANQRTEAFAAIREAGGKIVTDYTPPTTLERWFGQSEIFGHVDKIELREGKEKVNNALLGHIANLRELTHLDLSYAHVDDEGVRQLKGLPLVELWLQSTQITDASVDTISQMKSLRKLQVNATSLSDKFLEELEPLPDLENLGLRGSQVTGVGMQYVPRHPKLKTFDVYDTEVDDAGVESLVACPALERLGLSKTKITDASLESLDQMPKLTDVDLSGNFKGLTPEKVAQFDKDHPQIDVH